MKKIEKDFLNDFNHSFQNEKSFDDIKDKIDIERFEKKKTHIHNFVYKKLGIASVFILLVAIIIPTSISVFKSKNSNSNNTATANEDILSPNEEFICRKYRVNIEYRSGLADLSLEEKIDFNNYELRNTHNEILSKSNITGGDIVEVYSLKENQNEIDHVIIDEASYLILSVSHQIIPGSEGVVDLFVEGASFVIDHSEIKYVISEDGTYKKFNEDWHYKNSGVELYGTYREEEIETNYWEMKIYKLIALYDYNPKAK